jgi:hypothetical protein
MSRTITTVSIEEISNMGIPKGGNSILIYGESGTTKTTNVGEFAKFIYQYTAKKYGKGRTTRLITADGGGYRPIQPYIDAGIIDPPIHLNAIPDPLGSLKAMEEGRWPTPDPKNPKKLLPPKTWPITDYDGEGIGGMAIEGMTSICDVFMGLLTDKGPNLNNDASYAFMDGGYTFHGSSRTYYGAVQNFIQKAIAGFNKLPVERVLWTALEVQTEDAAKERIIGPALAGKARTAQVPQWVGECLHFEKIVTEGDKVAGAKLATIKERHLAYRAYFQPHLDPLTGRNHPCKPRVPKEQWETLMEKYPGGYFDLTLEGGLCDFLLYEEELLSKTTEQISTWKKQVDDQQG